VVTDADTRAAIVAAAKKRTDELKALVARGHHAEELGSYADFIFEPLMSAAVVVVPQVREYPDQMEHFIRSGGGDPAGFSTPASMQMELCGVSASVMLLLLQARAEGIGACWMAGPMVARAEIEEMLEIRSPYRMLGAVALGHPLEDPPPTKRKPLERTVRWFESKREGE
jgi:nitroreductase